MPAPDDIQPGAIPRHPPCHLCDPHEHHVLPCDRIACDCSTDFAPGLD